MTTNTLSIFDPNFYAQEALIALQNNLGMARRMYRGYDKAPQQKGSVINIPIPSTFTAQDAPSSAQNIVASSKAITLNQWKETKFALTDKELTFTGEEIIAKHIQPAAYSIANAIDALCTGLTAKVGNYSDAAGATLAWADITGSRAVLRGLKAPIDEPGKMHFMVDGNSEASLLGLAQWNVQSTAPVGDQAQARGTLGTRLNTEFFVDQNTPSRTPGVSADATGALTADAALGASSIQFDSVTSAGTFKSGDSFTIAGDTQRYVFTATNTASGGAVTAAAIFPPLKVAHTSGQVITINLKSAAYVSNCIFHENAFALAMAPLSTMGDGLGASIANVTDPNSGLSLRSRVYYLADSSEIRVAIDALFGVDVLDVNLACNVRV